jgi:hypothetical protein
MVSMVIYMGKYFTVFIFYMHNRDVCSHRGQGMFTYCKHQTLLSGPWPGIMPSGKWGVEDLEALMHASYFSRPDGTVS